MTGFAVSKACVPAAGASRPRLGFLGAGWIGLNRLQAVAKSDLAAIVAVADPSEERRTEAAGIAPEATAAEDLDALLEMGLDGIVIATPSALHAMQSIAALEAGVAVFCQKPLGRTAVETGKVVDAARKAGLPLGVDLSYRRTAALEAVRAQLAQQAIGEVFAADLVFHNAYGPDKAWSQDPELAGGGCVVDLGVHLADALLWCLDYPAVASVAARLMREGRPLGAGEVEDFALATIDIAGGGVARMACSWRMHAGCDAEVALRFHGSEGTLVFENVGGSFYDFRARLLKGSSSQVLCEGPDDWGGRMAVDWTQRLARREGFDPVAWRHVETARLLDRIYGRSPA